MHISLNGDDWQFKDFVGEDWRLRRAQVPDTTDTRGWRRGCVPGSVQQDLWQLGEIPDLYYERNSLLSEWVPQRTWVYKKSFSVPAELRGRRVVLCFEGVDYEAEFYLNGESLGTHRSMYTPAAFEVGERLRYGEANLLAVVIEPAPHEQPQIGRTSRVRTHKARMGYWWDFSPRVVHLGIWEGVYLDVTGPVRIEDVYVRPQLSDSLDHARVGVTVTVSASHAMQAVLQITLCLDGEVVAAERVPCTLPAGESSLESGLALDHPHLWWPNGCTEDEVQPLYEAEVSVAEPAAVAPAESDRRTVSFGIRRIEMLPNDTPDPTARPYTFSVNGRKIYAKGWNWVPMDVLYGVERPAKLERLLQLARRAHVNLLRVWGGGLIEREAFYDLCDRYGIMVWQEFIQSSSGVDNCPSDDPAFVAKMVGEAERIIPRKRNHPSLAVWCGGNELMPAPEQPADDSLPVLAALHDVVRRLDAGRHWLPTSASGRLSSNSLANITQDPLGMHDVHGPWEHQGLTGQYALYNQGASLFHSEFGVEGYTNLKTIEAHIALAHRWPATRDNPVLYHTASWWIKEATIQETFGEVPDLPHLVLASQFLQADGLRYAVEADRRRQYRNSGTLPWQFNEPFPNVACTSAVDYHGQPKPVYYAVARAYEGLHVSARFATQAWGGCETFEAEAWVSSSATEGAPAQLSMKLVGTSGHIFVERSHEVSFGANGSQPLATLSWPLSSVDEDIFFLDLTLSPAGKLTPAHNRYLFSRGENLSPMFAVPPADVAVTADKHGDRWTLTLANTGDAVSLPIWLEDGRPTGHPVENAGYVYFGEDYFCLLPGENRTLVVEWAGVPAAERRIEIHGWNIDTIMVR